MGKKKLQESVYKLFQEKYQMYPNKTIILEYSATGNRKSITYKELFFAVDTLAKKIEDQLGKAQCAIGVYGDRSISMAASILAILKSGNYFVPMNRDYSAAYLESIVKDAKIELILSNDDSIKSYQLVKEEKIIQVDRLDIEESQKVEQAEDRSLSSIPLFVLFTSGTSGKPKGVVHNQRQIMNFCNHMWKKADITDKDIICQRTRLEYIPSMWELFGGLLRGMKIVMLSDIIALDPMRNLKIIKMEGVTIVQGIPSFLERMFHKKVEIEQCESIRLWITIGEPAKEHLLNMICEQFPKASFIADYGATEIGGVLQYTRKDYENNNHKIPWYEPIDNVRISIRNEDNSECGINEEGSLCIEGVCVAIRYLDDDAIKSESIVCKLDGKRQFYNTGDMAVRLDTGRIKILGRKDRQEKIGGVRIELSVIENAIEELEHVQEAVVHSIKRASGINQIAAFIVMDQSENYDSNKILNYLEECLPKNFIPNQVMFLTQIPRLYNGKVDSKKLEQEWEAHFGRKGEKSKEKITSWEQELALIASAVLEVDVSNIDIYSTFKRIGFDSLLIVDYLERINEKYNLSLVVSDLYENPSVSSLAKKLGKQSTNKVRVSNHKETYERKVAVIGLSCTFPGAGNIDEYWSNLKEGKDSIQYVPISRWDWKKYKTENIKELGKSVCAKGGFLDEVKKFDYSLFNISKKEAILMEPQLRLLLEESYHGLEDAGYYKRRLDGQSVGVFVGAGKGDYIDLLQKVGLEYEPFVTTGCDTAMMASRISSYFNLTGPCMTIDSACASSLIAVHMGVKSILEGNCSMAIAGGIHIMNTPRLYLKSSGMNILAEDGVCKAFDKDGHGFVPGEGSGILVLKELEQAIKDHDQIYAVIKGSNTNQNGETDSITAPSPSSQKELLVSTYKKNEIDPSEIGYVEAHGTGTRLGDPIELKALDYAFRQFTDRKQYCAVGSVKTNIGHGITSAGIAGLIKAILSVKYDFIPKTLHCTVPNPLFDFENSPFYVCNEARSYPKHEKRVAAISSFGLNGSNCHMVVESYEMPKTRVLQSSNLVFPFSAKSEESLRRYLGKFVDFMSNVEDESSLYNISYTLRTCRKQYSRRVAFVASTTSELVEKVNGFLSGEVQAKDNVPWPVMQHPGETVSLPMYEFDNHTCWFSEIVQKASSGLVFEEIEEGGYLLSLDSSNRLLQQHMVNGQVILPASFMMNGIAELLHQKDVNMQFEIKAMQFKKLYTIDEKHKKILFSFIDQQDGYRFTISDEKSSEGCFAEGIVSLHKNKEIREFDESNLDCILKGSEIYEEYRKRNISFGVDYQCIDKLWLCDDTIFCKLKDVEDGYDVYENQRYLEAALHGIIGFNIAKEDSNTYVPVYMKSIQFVNYLEKPCYSAIKILQEEDGVIECEYMMLLGEHRNPLVVIEHALLKAIRSEIMSEESDSEIVYLTTSLVEEKIKSKSEDRDVVLFIYDDSTEMQALDIGKNRLGRNIYVKVQSDIHGESNVSNIIRKLDNELSCIDQIVYLPASTNKDIEKEIEKALESQIEPVRQIVTHLTKSLIDHRVRFLLCYQEQDNLSFMVNQAMQGFLRTVHTENSLVEYKVIEICDTSDFVSALCKELGEDSENEYVRYSNDTRFIHKMEVISANPSMNYSYHGAYIITGGLGTIGYRIAHHIVSTSDAAVILLGRSDYKKDKVKAERIRELEVYGSKIFYHSVDLSCESQVNKVVDELHKHNARITGVIHCAGVLNDRLIVNKTKEEFYNTIRPKVYGLLNLSKALKEDQLELMVLCSSRAAIKGKAGQSDYAFANAFLDAFSQMAGREALIEHIVSINWPLWENANMTFSDKDYKQYKEEGYVALKQSEGIEILDNAINFDINQIIVEKRIIKTPLESKNDEVSSSNTYTKEEILDICLEIFQEQLLETESALNASSKFSDLGITSLNVFDILDKLEIYFGTLPKTILYTLHTIEELVQYLIKKCQIEFVKESHEEKVVANNIESKEDNPIVIVGVAGRYPKADTIEALWENISSGKDCITEIPCDRWNESIYYEPHTKDERKHYVKWGGFISDIKSFDNLFFHISAKEAILMDPQERLFLQVVWELLESSGYKPSDLSGKKVAVFVGAMWNQYQMYGASDDVVRKPKSIAASIANRVSYLLNLRGISVSIDTMCSSSLTAMYMAQNALVAGEAEISIVGGVNLIVHPSKYHILCQEKFASSDGKCRSFGKDGDGYVPGEGIGALLLTKESVAKSNHLHIYAILRSCAINHGGKTNGYTVPDSVAQSEVILDALEKAKVNPEQISYLEAHGTGTSLGDPIEIEGITRAFSKYTNKKQYCAIGSVKSNIGHLESASAMASITKILLQMKYGKLVPSIHSEIPNPFIDFENSPVHVQTKLEDWTTLRDSSGQYAPRIAGVSSFGAGGTNGFLLLEEYRDSETYISDDKPHSFNFSARSEEQLMQIVKEYQQFLSQEMKKGTKRIPLQNIAYTTQVGREEYEWRLAIIASDYQELLDRLDLFLKKEDCKYIVSNEINAEDGVGLSADMDVLRLNTMDLEKEYFKLADLWTKGVRVEWKKLYLEEKVEAVSLPCYPFRKDSYWINDRRKREGKLSAFLDENLCTKGEARFRANLKMDDERIAMHRVGDRIIVPGSVILEMVCEAAACCYKKNVLWMQDIIWSETIEITSYDKSIDIILMEENDEVRFLVEESNKVRYTKGIIGFNLASESVPSINIEKETGNTTLNEEDIYESFSKRSLEYGLMYRALERIDVYEDALVAVLKREAVSAFKGDYIWLPNVLDGILQAVIGFEYKDTEAKIPVNIERIEVYQPLTQVVRIIARKEGNRYSVLAVDEQDHVILSINNLVLKAKAYRQEENQDILLLKENWVPEKELSAVRKDEKIILIHHKIDDFKNIDSENVIQIVHGLKFEKDTNSLRMNLFEERSYERLFDWLQERYPEANRLIYYSEANINLNDGGVVKDHEYHFRPLFYLAKALERKCQKKEWMCLFAFYGKDCRIAAEPLAALWRCKYSENEKHRFTCIASESKLDWNVLCEESYSSHENGREVYYGNEGRTIRKITDFHKTANLDAELYREGEVYLITGGTGNIGKLLAEDILQSAPCKVVLIGRKERGEVSLLTYKKGGSIDYIQADVSDYRSILKAYCHVKEKYSRLDGVFHCAGVLNDSLFKDKEEGQLESVFAPKINGLIWLSQLTKQDQLRFFVCFSSVAALVGSKGQTDYAYANRFMDSYVRHENARLEKEGRVPYYYAIDWSIWKDGSMKMPAFVLNHLKKANGLELLDTKKAFNCLKYALLNNEYHIGVFQGDRKSLINWVKKNGNFIGGQLDKTVIVTEDTLVYAAPEKDDTEGYYDLEQLIKRIVSEVTQIPLDRLSAKCDFEDYGIDSIMTMEMEEKLNVALQIEEDDIFIKNHTINEVCEYLTKRKHVNQSISDEKIGNPLKETVELRKEPQSESAVAIIGMACRFPDSNNLCEFEENLKRGKNCIKPYPLERQIGFANEERECVSKRYGGFITDKEAFHPLFFHIAPVDAMKMSLHTKLGLEITWNALEDAGINKDYLLRLEKNNEKVGVFIGCMEDSNRASRVGEEGNWSIANRISYFLNISGPSLVVDSACSSSIVALDLAIKSLQNKECAVAIVGGINLNMTSNKYSNLEREKMLSSYNISPILCGGDGYLPGEGVGILVLRRFEDAKVSGNKVYSLIKKTSIMHSGKTKAYKVPSQKTVRNMMDELIHGEEEERLSYIELASNGNSLIEQAELEAIANVLEEKRATGYPVIAGSVKSLIGHLEGASGVSQIIKVALQQRSGGFFPSLCEQAIDRALDVTPYHLSLTREYTGPLRSKPGFAIVNSIGAGGTYGSVLMEAYVEESKIMPNELKKNKKNFLLLSTMEKETLKKYCNTIADYLEEHREISIAEAVDVLMRREVFDYRVAVIGDTRAEVIDALKRYAISEETSDNTIACCCKTTSECKEVILSDTLEDCIRSWAMGKNYNFEGILSETVPDILLPQYPFTNQIYGNGVEEAAEDFMKVDRAGKKISLTDVIKEELSRILKIATENLKEDITLEDYGVTSLALFELKERLTKRMTTYVPLKLIYQNNTIRALAKALEDQYNVYHCSEAVSTTEITEVLDTSCELSEAQKGIWVTQNMEPNNSSYNLGGAFYIDSQTDVLLLEKAANQVLSHHVILKAKISEEEQGLCQSIEETRSLHIRIVHCENMEKQKIEKLLEQKKEIAYNLEQDLLVRGYLFKTGTKKDILLFCFHHIIFDFISAELFWRELSDCYENIEADYNEREWKFKQYKEEEEKYLNNERAEIDKCFFMDLLKADDFSARFGSETQGRESYEQETLTISNDWLQLFKNKQFGSHVTLAAVFIGLYQLAIGMVNKKETVVIGMPVNLRKAEYKNTMGCYINMVLFKTRLEDQMSLYEYFKRINMEMIEVLEHASYPIRLLESALEKMGIHDKELITYSFYYMDERSNDSQLCQQEVLPIHQKGEYPFVLEVRRHSDGIKAWVRYDSSRFSNEYVAKFKECFYRCQENVARGLDISLGSMTDCDRAQEENYIVSQFIKQVELNPSKLALVYKERKYSYESLYVEVRTAEYLLKEAGVRTGDRVGVCLKRGENCVISLLAIQWIGAVYVPIDRKTPKSRLEIIVEEASIRFMISSIEQDRVEYLDTVRYIELSNNSKGAIVPHEKIKTLEKIYVDPEDAAYIIFTSGTTGKPKGIMVSNDNLKHFLQSVSKVPGCCEQDYLLALTTSCFDISILEFLLPIINGATVEVLPESVIRDGIRLLEYLRHSKPTIVQATPTSWKMLLEAGWNEKLPLKILIGGEAFSESLKNQLVRRSDECWNMYGPTETTIWSMMCQLRESEEISLGNPIGETKIKILDANKQEVGIGEVGELYIGGKGVSKGYLNREEETKKYFIKLSVDDREEEVFYRTGDLVKVSLHNKIQYIGRTDFQVKRNGYRIELGDIKNAIIGCKQVKDVEVLLHKESERKEICAFIILDFKADSFGWKEQIEETMKKRLPEYMIPNKIVVLEHFPVTENMKVDFKYLSKAPYEKIIREYSNGIPSKERAVDSIHESEILKFLIEQTSRLAGISSTEIELNAPIGSYGLGSLEFTRLCNLLNKEFGLNMNASLFYTYSTITEIEMYIQSRNSKTTGIHKEVESCEDVAIVGIAGVFPGCDDVDEFWEKLLQCENMVTKIPADRWEQDSIPMDLREAPNYGGFIKHLYDFDEELFGISPAEAKSMDPQQRLMLSVVWTLFENAGYSYQDISGKDIGVYIGATGADFAERVMQEKNIDSHMISGMANAIIANRVSYCFNLQGPSEVLETACSSSLVAVCHAVESITSGQCSMAIAGGVNVILSPFVHGALNKGRMLSPDGQCKTFDHNANGYVRGEGCATILLKSLKQAREDKDRIYAVIKGYAMNHGGKTNSLTAPNGKIQKELILSAMNRAKVNPQGVGYIETHGAGTVLGDPIEVKAIQEAYDELRQTCDKQTFDNIQCGLGSVKTNIGHLESAAGIAGLIKVALAIYHKIIPASRNLQVLNPYLELDENRFKIITGNTDFARRSEDEPLIGAVSSFGFGGTNAHVILAEEKQEVWMPKHEQSNLFVLSARGPKVLEVYVRKWVDYLGRKIELKERMDLESICYNLQIGRTPFKYRIAVVASSIEELYQELLDYQNGLTSDKLYFGIASKEKEKMEKQMLSYGKSKSELQMFAQYFTEGGKIQWRKFYKNDLPYKDHYPTYPFQRKQYGIPDNRRKEDNTCKASILLEIIASESIKEGLVFGVALTEENIHASHHLLEGKKIVPCAIYLELIQEVYRKLVTDGAFEIQDYRIYCPIYFENQSEINLKIVCLNKDGKIEVQIYLNEVLQCEASVCAVNDTKCVSEDFDLVIQELLQNETSYNKEQCYKIFLEEGGLQYGDFYRSISSVVMNQEMGYAVLQASSRYQDTYLFTALNPAIIDGIFQCAGLLYRGNGERRIPVNIRRMKVLKPLTDQEYQVVVKMAGDQISCQLRDVKGASYVMIEGYQGGPITKKEVKKEQPQKYVFDWKKETLLTADDTCKITNTLVLYNSLIPFEMLNQDDSNIYVDISDLAVNEYKWEWQMEEKNINTILLLALAETHVEDMMACVTERTMRQGFYFYLDSLTAIMKLEKRALNVYVVTNQVFDVCNEEIVPTNSFLSGLNLVAGIECGRHKFFNIDWDSDIVSLYANNWSNLANVMYHAKETQQTLLAVRSSEVYSRNLTLIDSEPKENVLRSKGTYIILGAGGIGTALARYLVERYAANVLLVGRRKMEALPDYHRLTSMNISYIQMDGASLQELRALLDFSEAKYKTIDGIFSCMMVMRNEKIARWTKKAMEEVLYSKVNGSIMLHEAIKDRNIGFWGIFSSISSFLPIEGQAGYASACAFQDSFAALCNKRCKFPVKLMNWSYWGEDGYVKEPLKLKRLDEAGMLPIDTKQGFVQLEQCLGNKRNQIIIMNTSKELRAELLIENGVKPVEKRPIDGFCFERLEEYCIYRLLEYFKRHNLISYVGQSYTVSKVSNVLNVIPKYDKFVEAMLEILSKAGFIQLDGDKISVRKDAANVSGSDCKRALMGYQNIDKFVTFLDTCIQEYDSLLSGEKSYVDVLFAKGAKGMVSQIYSENPEACKYIEKMGEYVTRYLNDNPSKKVKILEIGAGTGVTASIILEGLNGYEERVQYFYTDISLSFLKYAREKFSKYGNVTYQLFNLEKEIEKQGFEANQFDLVLCSDVVHATSDIEKSLKSIALLLKEDGVFLLNEITKFQNYATLTFGLTDGWWTAADSYRMKGSALLNVSTWETVLKKMKFEISQKHEEIDGKCKSYETLFCCRKKKM